MQVADLHAQMRSKLESAGLSYETLKVFGAIRCNVHVTCQSSDTARKWGALLAMVFGEAPKIVPHIWDAKRNRGTCLLPTIRKGWLVVVSA